MPATMTKEMLVWAATLKEVCQQPEVVIKEE